MDFKNVRHLREVLITDENGKTTSTMQYSSQRISRFRPDFVPVPFKDQIVARELYLRMGGRRREGMKIGMDVILENNDERDVSE
ncbi:MAG TPA: hypothetical protein VFD70_19645 [Anaerolineae bacterium]|nr:hypothetical protein [Anaerolineae bacterium]